MIVKVQQSIASNLGYQTVLIYNRDRSIQVELPMTPAIKELIGNELKIFCQASLRDDPNNEGGKLIVLERRTEDFNW